jgi:hypothetical protein
MKKLLLISFCLLLNTVAFSRQMQDSLPPNWQSELTFGFNVNQASFSDNWQGGGVNSVAFNSLILGEANYKKGKFSADFLTDLQYGLQKNQGLPYRKTNDRLMLDAKAGVDVSTNWNLYGAMNFLTQFDDGFNFGTDSLGRDTRTKISDFMAPGFLTFSLGAEYKPVEWFFVRLSPFAPRFTFVTDEDLFLNVPRNYGVTPGETVRTEWLAAQVQAALEKDLKEDLNLRLVYQLFANYETLAARTIDHRFDLAVTSQVWKLLQVSLNATLLYDYDQDEDVQLSQGLGVGIVVTLPKAE